MIITNTTGTERYACSLVHFTGEFAQVHLLQDGTPVAMMYHKALSWEEAQRVYGLAKALVQKLNRGDSRKEESLQQMATAWEKVFLTLCKVCPGWNEGESTAMDLAVKCIEQLANPPAQAAQVDGIAKAAAYIQKKADDYAAENCSSEPDTGAPVYHFGNAGMDYHHTLIELAEEVAGLSPPTAEPVAQGEAVAFGYLGERELQTMRDHGYAQVLSRPLPALRITTPVYLAAQPIAVPDGGE